MIRKLRLKFVLINMSIVAVLLGIILGLIFSFTKAGLERENIRMLQTVAEHPLQLKVPADSGNEVKLPFFIIRKEPGGELLAENSSYYDLSDKSFLSTLMGEASASPRQFGVIDEYQLRYYRVDMPGEQYVIFSDISSETATLNHLKKNCVLIWTVSFALFFWASIWLSGWASRPVAQAWKQQKQFVADASHELKTPLTVIITSAELAQNESYDLESRQKVLNNVVLMSRQMKGLVEQLLELARTDKALEKRGMEEVSFSKLVSDALLPFEPLFFEQELKLVQQIEEDIKVCGDGSELKRAVEILLDNAGKYTRPFGMVRVELKRKAGRYCLLQVASEGDGLSEEQLKNIFKRFYRADQARSQSKSFGLGLSIAEGIVRRHKGKIWARSSQGVNSFFILLPCK
ncbi:Probable sensor histidine kinase TcrY [uncultured Roseburia sp.]|uniref:histidine kinase n=1 Tax=Brotonthovivens ammoniilytica TaxID=2981725 RepID=A0ABT2TLD0_9FIRM|nr:HAMP domain-containing sensor histidine kinase [Brotonthovivens ammoniilytica]MCU6763005.1 HAMP domain-containing histidine kinase [Brotonthovivens ammoniilytica]SCJ00166.1 Probable sensor histidine kinase TcrY [uncultured Roseburia sp.]